MGPVLKRCKQTMITVDGKQMPWKPEMTLGQLMGALEGGHLYAVVRLNGRLVSRPNFADTPVQDGDDIEPLPLIAGG